MRKVSRHTDAGLLCSKPVVVGNACRIDILEEAIRFVSDQVIKTLAAALLHTLKAHLEVDRELCVGLLVCFNDIEPANARALIIRGASAEHLARGLIVGKLERLSVPAVGNEGWLNATEQITTSAVAPHPTELYTNSRWP